MKTVIKNGTIIDGTGKAAFPADIVIENDTISNIGNFPKATGDMVVDARGRYIVPGFIDILNHSDSYWTLFKVPAFDSLVTQGITTILVGNCGSSLAPLVDGETILSIQKWADISEVNVNWLRVSEFLDELSRRKLGLNFATLVGHGTLRRGILHDEFRALSNGEIEKMNFLLRSALDEGAFGMSVGLAYSHAKVASPEEIEELARIVGQKRGILTFHLRDEATEILGAVNEVLGITRRTNISSHISHFKVMGKENWEHFDKALKMIEGVNAEALDVTFDMYPYSTIASVLYIFLPDWISKGGRKMLIRRLKDPLTRSKVIEEMKQKKHVSYKDVWIASGPKDKTFIGKSISDIARNQGVDVEEAIINMLIASNGKIIAFIPGLDQHNLLKGAASKYSFISTDGFGVKDEGTKHDDLVHPRCFGAFPRALHQFVKETKVLSWEAAISKMTSGPAQKIQLVRRGEITKGYFADIVILNQETIRDTATFTNPYRYSQGVDYVLINGKIVVEEGKRTGEMSGRVLRRK